MAIEIQSELAEPTGRGPRDWAGFRSYWLRTGIHTGVILAAVGYLLGHLLGNFLSSGYQQNALSDSNDVPIVLAPGTGHVLAGMTRLSNQRPSRL